MEMTIYMPPIAWNDLSMNWNTPDIRYVEYSDALRLAIAERYKTTDLIGYTDVCASESLYKGMALSYSLLAQWHHHIMFIASYFVNHTIQNGDFSGLSTIPMWTIKDMLEYLGESELLQPQPHSPDNNAWAAQMYRLLNLMRWTKYNIMQSTGNYQNCDGYGYDIFYGNFYGNSWNELLGKYTESKWGYYTNGALGDTPIRYMVYCWAPYSSPFFSGGLLNRISDLKIVSDGIDEIDYYVRPSVILPAVYGGTSIYQPLIPGVLQGAYNKVKTIQITDRQLTREQRTIFAISDFNPAGKIIPSLGVTCCFEVKDNNAYAVQKFDGPNGFKFRNW